ncbi:hypothetical protein FBU30_004242 [Linnemannia zychae]|nr:hypothetical protein FBU30_004242 [Linnemannia zychae]
MTKHPSNTHTSSSIAGTTTTDGTAASSRITSAATTTGTVEASSLSNNDQTAAFSQQGQEEAHVEPQVLSHEEGAGWERTVTQVPGEEPVHSIKLISHVHGIPGRR